MCLSARYTEHQTQKILAKCETEKMDGKTWLVGYKIVKRLGNKLYSGVFCTHVTSGYTYRDRINLKLTPYLLFDGTRWFPGDSTSPKTSYKTGCHVYVDKEMAQQHFESVYGKVNMCETYFLIPVYFLKRDVLVVGKQKYETDGEDLLLPTAVVTKYYIQPSLYNRATQGMFGKSTNLV